MYLRNTTVSAANMSVAKQIVENRVNALGVTEPLVQQARARTESWSSCQVKPIQKQALAVIKQTGLLEFVDMTSLTTQEAQALVGTKINTDWIPGWESTFFKSDTTPITPGAPALTLKFRLPHHYCNHHNHLHCTSAIRTNFSYCNDRFRSQKCRSQTTKLVGGSCGRIWH